METYLTMTQINDFIFCPRSLFFHDFLRENFTPDHFREQPQIQGLAEHSAIDHKTYSSCKDILQGTMVYSTRYRLLGRIDLFHIKTGILTERKYSVTAIYPGFRYQLYAQYFALSEMGYIVNEMVIYSAKDNKKYKIEIPAAAEINEFENVLLRMQNYVPEADTSIPNINKCQHCNYRDICSFYPEEERL